MIGQAPCGPQVGLADPTLTSLSIDSGGEEHPTVGSTFELLSIVRMAPRKAAGSPPASPDSLVAFNFPPPSQGDRISAQNELDAHARSYRIRGFRSIFIGRQPPRA